MPSLRLLALLAVAGDALVATTRRAAPAVARRSATHTIEAREVEGPLEPLSNYLLVKVDPIKDTSGGGIILGSASEPASTGEVVSAGPPRGPESGVLLPAVRRGRPGHVSENAGATASGLLLGLGAQDKISLTGEVVQEYVLVGTEHVICKWTA
ncbi:hypothetical protein JL722_80 [Aureococcus anophagefferens]|nr:hypothetical protein JL722_80 [Aureococcus anophagefferens]